ncbi:MAG TPA: ParA family protein [Spirochaetota bacterium]|nr:ParA family protein [Spirochaetota bacterium]
MRIIAVSNNKGGVGKTTSTVNIAAALHILNKKVLVIDIDHQAQATYHLGINPKELNYSIFELLKGEITYNDLIFDRNGLSVLPAKPDLKDLDFLPFPAKEFLLKEAMEKITGFDFVLIDCPPSLGILTLNALAYANEIFIPLQLQFLPFHGMYNLFEGVQMVKQRLNKAIEITGIIGTMYNSTKTINKEVLDETESRLPGKLFNTIIRENVSLQEAPSWGKTIFEYKPESNGATDYMNLTKEIIKRYEQI